MTIAYDKLRAGPLPFEESLLAQLGIVKDEPKLATYTELIWRLEGNRRQKDRFHLQHSFAMGHLYRQAAKYAGSEEDRDSLLRSSVEQYQTILQKGDARGEEYFYACLAAGQILLKMEHSWPAVEGLFLRGYEAAPARGESIKRIIQYYLSEESWPIAYIYSRFAMDHYFEKLPGGMHWGVEEAFYRWEVLDMHFAAAYSLGKTEEAADAFQRLYSLSLNLPGLFTTKQMEIISSRRQLFSHTHE